MAKQIFILFLLVLASTATYAAFPLKNQSLVVVAGVPGTEIKAGCAIELKPGNIARSGGMFDGPWKLWNILLLCLLGIIIIAVLIILLSPSDV